MASGQHQESVVGVDPFGPGADGNGADVGVNGSVISTSPSPATATDSPAANITSNIPAAPITAPTVSSPVTNLNIRTVNGVNPHSPTTATTSVPSPVPSANVARPPQSTPAKIRIVDPAAGPGGGTPSQPLRPATGFPSPGREKVHTNTKFIDDRTRITFGIQQSLPEAVRRSVRDNWEKCLLGSDFHQAFVLNASIHHATPAAIQRGMRDFGKAFIAAAKQEMIQQMTAADLDQVVNSILARASDSFLDKALEKRLQTIEATKLINALARAERLGYEPGDEDEGPDDDADATILTPVQNVAPQPAVPSGSAPAAAATSPNLLNGQIMHCTLCFRRFSHRSAYDYHIRGKVCTRSPNSPGGFKFNCQHCGQGFTTAMGLQYHNSNKVCGDFGDSTTGSSPAIPTPPASIGRTQMPSTPVTVKTASSAPASSPANSTPGLPGFSKSGGAASDPYAHLSPEQLRLMQEELREAELTYGERMRQANLIVDENEKKSRLDALSNSFGTKQSLIRKKYGVRLRMRRTKAEIQAERDRMQYKTAAELQADMGIVHNGAGRPPTSTYSAYRPSPHSNGNTNSNPNSRPGSSGGRSSWAAVNQPQTAAPSTVLASSLPAPQPKPEAAPQFSTHSGTKRHLSSAHGDSPNSKRVAYTDMSGLSGVGAEAETTDPTLPRPSAKGAGTAAEPMALDSDSDDGDSDDEDIPAELPASVRQSLVGSSPVVVSATSSRPGSRAPM